MPRTHAQRGESEQRLDAIAVWREAPFFTDRERAALDWTEALTLISQSGVPDALYTSVGEHFSEREIVDLTLAVVTINGWNRLAISFRPVVGTYRPGSPASREGAYAHPTPGAHDAPSEPEAPHILE